jgi:hypothetical protein
VPVLVVEVLVKVLSLNVIVTDWFVLASKTPVTVPLRSVTTLLPFTVKVIVPETGILRAPPPASTYPATTNEVVPLPETISKTKSLTSKSLLALVLVIAPNTTK